MYRVLVADDERLEREALKLVVGRLTDIVCDVQVAANGRQAIQIAESWPPDIAILDIKMPGITGIEAARRIRELHPGCHVVFLTAFNHFDYAQEAIRLRADDFIIKPASDKRIEEVMRAVSDRLTGERPAPVDPEHESDERDLAESKLIGDAVLGHMDEELLRRYLQLDDSVEPMTTALVARLDYPKELFQPESARHRQIMRRRVLSILRHECALQRISVLASAETPSIYALLVDAASRGGLIDCSPIARLQAIAEREFGMHLSIGTDGPIAGLTGLGLRFANAGVAGRQPERRAGAEPPGSQAARRRVLDAEQQLVRTVVSSDQTLIETDVARLHGAIQAVAPGERFRDELSETLTYIAHATAMKLGPLPEDVAAIIREIDNPDAGPAGRNLLLATVAICERLAAYASKAVDSMHGAVVAAREFIDEHFRDELSLEQVAKHTRLSPFHLSRIFKSATRMTVLEYLTSRRVEEAQKLLCSTLLSIKEIASQVGYADQNYFSRVFRRHTGKTPSDYRRARR